MGTGATALNPTESAQARGATGAADAKKQAETEVLAKIEAALLGLGGESLHDDPILRHVLTYLTDEGLVIELFDLPDAPVFAPETAEPMPVLDMLALVLADVLTMVVNPLAIEGHTRRYSVVQRVDPGWPLSQARPRAFQAALESRGVDPLRVSRITGHADRRPVHSNPMAVRNNRLEVIVLRQM
jgi:chemotaxis protein MotB